MVFSMLCLVGILSACSHHVQERTSYHYHCESIGELRVEFDQRSVVISAPVIEPLTLPAMRSASGAKYGNEHIVFWTKDDEAILQLDGAQAQSCKLMNQISFI